MKGEDSVEVVQDVHMTPPLAPLLDVRALERLRALQDEEEPALLVELGRGFLARAVQRLGLLRTALAAGNARALEEHAHTLAGNSGMFGLMRLRDYCKALETLVRSGQLEGAGELLVLAERAFEEARPLLLAELGLQE